MKKQKITIEKYMTEFPHTIGDDLSLKTAQDLMQKYHCRHLPVQHAGKLVGVISDRDLKLALSFGDLNEMKVNEIMIEDPYAVSLKTPFSEVLSQMVAQKIGCAIITNDAEKVIGIFTATDGLKFLERKLENAEGHAA